MSALAIVTLSVGYTLIALVCARIVAGHLAWWFVERHNEGPYSYSRQRQPDGDQWFGAALCGCVAGAVWPALPFVVFVGPHFAVGAELRARVRAQQERIAELERELEVT